MTDNLRAALAELVKRWEQCSYASPIASAAGDDTDPDEHAAWEAARAALASPAPDAALPSFNDARVQIVYELLCDDAVPPKPEQHWEGFVAQRIVEALFPNAVAPDDAQPVARTFKQELEASINRYSMEAGSGTPDFIIAEYLLSCLIAFNQATQMRSAWHEPTLDAHQQQRIVEPLSDERIDEVLGEAFNWLAKETGYTGGMGSTTWDHAAARAIERAHGIGSKT